MVAFAVGDFLGQVGMGVASATATSLLGRLLTVVAGFANQNVIFCLEVSAKLPPFGCGVKVSRFASSLEMWVLLPGGGDASACFSVRSGSFGSLEENLCLVWVSLE